MIINNESTKEIEIPLKDGVHVYDYITVWNCISFENMDTILGYGNVYRYVRFKNIMLNDGTFEEIISQICGLEPLTVYKIINDDD